MASKKTITMPVNRVEGDLEIRLEVEDGRVKEAQSMGIMYRGIESLMTGRGPLDGLVITPRVCGICSTAHLAAAAKALDMIYRVEVPETAKKVRNISLAVEDLQNDMRHTFLLFMPDFTYPIYKDHPLYEEAVARYAPLKGTATIDAVRETKKILEVIAILGGQWPHSSFMVPGGVASVIGQSDIAQCKYLLDRYRKWYESRVIGCSLDHLGEVSTRDGLESWVMENDSQRESGLGFFIRFMKEAGLEDLGKGCGQYISFGLLDHPTPVAKEVNARDVTGLSPGFFDGKAYFSMDQTMITEDVSHSKVKGIGAKHPLESTTVPIRKDVGGDRYSWAKAPRYSGMPAETGPLAEMMVGRHPLYQDLVEEYGPSAFVRQLARITRPARLIPVMNRWLRSIEQGQLSLYKDHPMTAPDGVGFGMVEAPRGALGHWIRIRDNAIENYQIITPTSWNASPRDAAGKPGPFEASLVDLPVEDSNDPVAVNHVVHSFDPCMVCCVHVVDMNKR
jgi:hydrogenase large subunit